MIKVYGIPNCDTTKKAIVLLKKNNINFTFHDYKQDGITENKLKEWISKAGLEKVFNKRSTTYKELADAAKKKAETANGATEVMIQNNSIIKRPIIESGNALIVGFNEKEINTLKK